MVFRKLIRQTLRSSTCAAASNRIGKSKSRSIAKRAWRLLAFPGPGWLWSAGHEAGGRWIGEPAALRCLLKARELGIDPELISDALPLARLGAGGAEALVPELRIQVSSYPSDISAILGLTEALAAAGEPGKIDAELNAWQNRALPAVPPVLVAQVRAISFYHAGRVKDCADRCLTVPSLKSSALRVQSLLAQKKANEVTSEPTFEGVLTTPRVALSLCLAFSLQNQPDQAARWRDQAIASLVNGSRDIRRLAKILGAPGPTAVAEFDRLLAAADLKALVLAILAGRHPARRAEYLAAAARFNVRRRPPYQLVRLAIER